MDILFVSWKTNKETFETILLPFETYKHWKSFFGLVLDFPTIFCHAYDPIWWKRSYYTYGGLGFGFGFGLGVFSFIEIAFGHAV